MVSNFRIFTGILSGYVGLGLLYNTIMYYMIRQCLDMRTILKITIERPMYIKLLNTIFYPINKVMNYFRLKEILKEESIEDLESIFDDDDEDYYEE